MVTWKQVEFDTTGYISVDIYSKLPMMERPIPGYLLYTDGIGGLFILEGSGELRAINLDKS